LRRLVLATRNKGKVTELKELLADLAFEIVDLSYYSDLPEIIEDGGTFVDNAIIKAKAVAEYTGELSLADDSGLEVDLLNGEPGVYSARYGNPEWNDRERYQYLLKKLADYKDTRKTARFRCVMALYEPQSKQVEIAEGAVEGEIVEPRGNHGFGYDPVFYIPELGKTMAELSEEEKNRISHRSRAIANLKPKLAKV
jgi:XTP/dITP diphosphohydrolase